MSSIRRLVYAAAVGGLYAALTMVLAPISYGAVQFRLSEALCVLPFFLPSTSWGLFLGCAIANLFSAAGPLDVVFGSLATLAAARLTAAAGRGYDIRRGSPSLGRCALACLWPAVINAVVVGAVLAYAFAGDGFWQGLLLFGAQVGLGEAVVMLALGLPLMRLLPRAGAFVKFVQSAG